MSDLYVVVADNDGEHKMPSGRVFRDEMGALIFEQYTFNADMENIKERAEHLSRSHGRCRIARLDFTDIEYKSGKEIEK